jgi:tRNA threonylcarbamoyladenosine biosynthesis protein TsaE
VELTVLSNNPQETIRYGKILGSVLKPGSVIGLVGELGSGKTCFIKGLTAALTGIAEDEVTSPTFTFLQEFSGPLPLYHFDLYRIKSPGDLSALGFAECAYGMGVTVIEWADRAEAALPDECLIIYLEHVAESSRRLIFKACGKKHEEILRKIANELTGETYE